MFEIIPNSPKTYNIVQLSKTIGCRVTDFQILSSFISAWVCTFHPASLGWFDPIGVDHTTRYSTTEYPDYKQRIVK